MIDFSSVIHISNEMKNFSTAFNQTWPVDVLAPPTTVLAFFDLLPPTDEQPLAYHFYTDGSKNNEGKVGSAVILLVETQHGLHFGGCLHKRISIGYSAYAGENGAIVWALLWAVNLSDLHWTTFQTHEVAFTFNFDSTGAGFLAAGYWRTTLALEWRVLLRSLSQLLQTRHGLHNLTWNHIRAHAGHPWNEAADALAKFAATQEASTCSSELWEQWLAQPDKLTALQWLWYLELMEGHDHRVPSLHNGFMRCVLSNFDVKPGPPHVPVHVQDQHDEGTMTCFSFNIATANVMTLTAQAASRQMILMEQFDQQKCLIVGVQETRHRHVTGRNNSYYFILDHPATAAGCDGVQMWISKRIPYSSDGSLVQQHNLRVIASAPDYLMAKLHLSGWTCVFLTCRAPHSGRPVPECVAFWNNINGIIQKKAAGLPLFFVGDTNAHLGSIETDAVGPHAAVQENVPGRLFHDWMINHSLFVPATFSEYHHGSETTTYLAPDGAAETRIDYVALPQYLHYESVHSSVAEHIDLSILRCDHRVALCHLTFNIVNGAKSKRRSVPRFDLNDLVCKLQEPTSLHQLHDLMTTPSWTLPPHESAQWLASTTHTALAQLARPHHQWRRKTHISEETWELVERKKFTFKHIRALKRAQLYTVLHACFIGWKSLRSSLGTNDDHTHHILALLRDLPSWLRLHAQATALAQHKLCFLSLQVTLAIKKEDASYYQNLATAAAKTYEVEGLTGIWKHIRALLPKHRQRAQRVSRDIDHELQQHFAALEAGCDLSEEALHYDCIRRNAIEQAQQPRQFHLALEELPTLAEVEALCLKQKPRKAPGPDGVPSDLCRHGAVALAPHLHSVMCKSFIHGVEPISYKGGNLCAIFKGKGNHDDAPGYRGILLANAFAKITHAWSRQRLLPTLQSRRTIEQLGGLPSQQTITGVQIIRLFNNVAQQKHLPTAVLFIDLRSAFHHMIRELVFATSNTLLRSTLATFLNERDFDLDGLINKLDALCAQPVDDIPPGLRRFLHDLHHHTWFQRPDPTRPQNCLTHTLRGTRPGSPMADIGFNLMMSDLLKDVHQALLQDDAFCAGAEALGTFVPPIAWVDDVAVPLCTMSSYDLIPLVQRALAAVHSAFCMRGLTLNLDPGKTELIVMFRGAGAVPCRRALFLQQSQPTVTVATSTHVLTVRVVSSYRHLGVRFAMNLDLHTEIQARIGAARQAFQQLKKPVFVNHALPVPARLSLFQSLILSRLLYGCAIWSEISATSYRNVEALLTDCYRQILGIGFWTEEHVTDTDLYQTHQLIPFRVFLAQARLGYLQNVASYGMTAHKSLLLMESEIGKGWLHELQIDLAWLDQFGFVTFEVPTQRASWIACWSALRSYPSWRAKIRRAVKKHLLQENLAYEVRQYHVSIRSELEHAGLQFVDFPSAEPEVPQPFRCADCTATFETSQRLAVHAFRNHGRRALESYYAQSDCCPGCLRTFHTTFRVVQHLRYKPNQCWERIYGVRAPDTPGTVTLPPHLAGVHRLPAIRLHHGPLRPTAYQRERQKIRRLIAEVRQAGADDFAWWDPNEDLPLCHQCFRQFEHCLDQWALSDAATEENIHNQFFALFFSMAIPEFHAARIFIHWIETEFYDYIVKYEDFDMLDILETAHISFLSDIHIWDLRRRLASLQLRWDQLQQPESRAPLPKAVSQGHRAARTMPITSAYASMSVDECQRRAWRILHRPRRVQTPEQGPYYIIHLYSGRRRHEDFHAHMQHLLANGPAAMQSSIVLLSIDTAIHPDMNVHNERIWSFLLGAARHGRILALLLGPPSETWSIARYAKLYDDAGRELRGPRPLRSSESCWGLPSLSLVELQQVNVGNCLLLRGLWLCCPVALSGGSVLLEHPAPPHDMDKPAIWRTSLVLFMLRDGWLFRRFTFKQGFFGACGAKPTTLLHANCPIVDVLDEYALPSYQVDELIGKDVNGEYKTAKAKEYPPLLCQCFALAIWRQLQRRSWVPGDAPDPIAHQLATYSSRVDPASVMKPDYQPKC